MSKLKDNLEAFKAYRKLESKLETLNELTRKIQEGSSLPFGDRVKEHLAEQLFDLMGKDTIVKLLEGEANKMSAELADMTTIDEDT